MAKVEDGVFQASRGPLHLGEVLRLFRGRPPESASSQRPDIATDLR